MDQATFISLIQKYQSGEASSQEKALLEEYLLRMEAKEPTPASLPAAGNRVWERLQQQLHPPVQKVHILRRAASWWVAAGIALLLAAGTAYWLLTPAKQLPEPVTRSAPQDAAPAGNKALLTLADGTVINLDEPQNNPLPLQGNVQVSRSDSGMLTYKVAAAGSNAPLSYNTLTTPRGGQYKIILADGSVVWLNAASSLRYPAAFTSSVRQVEVTGEAYFEVAKKPEQPFIVTVQGVNMQVLGTSFNVNAYEKQQGVITTLVEGRLKVTAPTAAVILKPGQQSVAGTGNIKVQTVDPEQAIAWKHGLFVFNNASLQEVMEQLSRWYDVDIIYNTTSNVTFEGEIQRNLSLSQVLKHLEQKDVKFKLNEKTLTVTQ